MELQRQVRQVLKRVLHNDNNNNWQVNSFKYVNAEFEERNWLQNLT